MGYNQKFCIFCEKESELEHIKSEEEWVLGGVQIRVIFPFYRCPLCKEEFWITGDCDPFEYAYKEYEKITGKKWMGGESEVISRKEIKND